MLTMVNLSLVDVIRIRAAEIWRQHGGNDDGDSGMEVWPSTTHPHHCVHTCPLEVHITDIHLLLCLPLT